MNAKLIEEVANAVLYEGYLLYPYRASAVKNRQRWNFGVVYPPAYALAQSGADASEMRVECLAWGRSLNVRVRFLQLITRQTLDATGAAIDSWQEAGECEVSLEARDVASLRAEPVQEYFAYPALEERDPDYVVRRREAMTGLVELSSEPVGDGWFRLRLTIANTESFEGAKREQALLHSFVSTHAILSLGEGQFASLLDPPEDLTEAAAECRNAGAYPVLAGEEGVRDAMLCSPVILYDYPQIAPESAGALFDGTEIDEILSLRILTMTDDEKQEMREVDGFARQILERTEALTPDQFMKMHGTLRQPHPTGGKQ